MGITKIRNGDGNGNGVRTATRETNGVGEETPLLRDDGGTSGDGVVGGDAEIEEMKENRGIGKTRGTFMILSVLLLILQLTSNIVIITTTQSKIAEDIDAFAEIPWLTSTYMICSSSATPLVAKLAQIFSPKIIIMMASILFGVGGMITSQGKSLHIFLLGRAISGIGASAILVISFILVLEFTSKKRRGLFFGMLNSAFTMGMSLGAVVTGALLPIIGWRFLFLVQGPLALIGCLGIFFSIPAFPSTLKLAENASIGSKLAGIDYLGAATLASAIVVFLVGFSLPNISWTLILIAPLLLTVFVFIEAYIASDPIIPVTVLKSRGLLISCLAQLGIMIARFFITLYTPVYAIAVRGWSPASAGSILFPTNIGFALGGLLTGGFHIRRAGSFWSASVVCYILFTCTLMLFSCFSTPATPAVLYILLTFANGFFTGAGMNYTLAHMLHLTPTSTHFISTSLIATFRSFAGSFSSSIGGGAFVRELKENLERGFAENGIHESEQMVRKLVGSPAMVKNLVGVEKIIAISSYVAAMRRLFLFGAGLALVMVFIQAATGWNGPKVADDVEEVGNGRGFLEEEWEEGMEYGN